MDHRALDKIDYGLVHGSTTMLEIVRMVMKHCAHVSGRHLRGSLEGTVAEDESAQLRLLGRFCPVMAMECTADATWRDRLVDREHRALKWRKSAAPSRRL